MHEISKDNYPQGASSSQIPKIPDYFPNSLAEVCSKYLLSAERMRLASVQDDKMWRFINQSTASVPPYRLIDPAPQILERIEAGVRPEPEGSSNYEMFSQLLSRACDRDRVWEAHPAFPGLIQQLSSDEALLLSHLRLQDIKHTATQDLDQMKGLFDSIVPESMDFDSSLLAFPSSDRTYMSHLITLGLVEDAMNDTQQTLYLDPSNPDRQTGLRLRQVYKLTAFGRMFAEACISD